MKKKTTKSYDFIQLGRKVNGRIKCNEEYKLDEVFESCKAVVKVIARAEEATALNWFDKTFKTKKYHIYKASAHAALTEIENVHNSFRSMITADLAGLVKKGKKK